RVVWTGATAEDVETSITVPIEQQLRAVDDVKKMTSTSSNGIGVISLEYHEGTDIGIALDEVKQQVALIRNLPEDSEAPEITRIVRYDGIARLLITGPADPGALREVSQSLRNSLLDAGIAKVDITGLPEEKMAVQVPAHRLAELGLSLREIADRIDQRSVDLPAGSIGRGDGARQLRSLDQRRNEIEFAHIPLITDQAGRRLSLGDIATIERRPQDGESYLSHEGKPAVELYLRRAESEDALEAAETLYAWLEETRPKLPPSLQLELFDESWTLIQGRINILLKNGAWGLLLVVAILFLALNARVAWWVTAGIPISFMATLAILYSIGGTINMISLFGLIMALGIIVDDAIVVGEDALVHYKAGEGALSAARGGAQRMFTPVLSSSLTTIAAFLPLMLVGGVFGNILSNIPLVVVIVILASLLESFLVLPAHLRHALTHMPAQEHPLRTRIDGAYNRFRDHHYRRWVTHAVHNRWTTLSILGVILILMVGLVLGGRINFTFFPRLETSSIYANASFTAGTPRSQVDEFLQTMEQALAITDQDFGGDFVVQSVTHHGATVGGRSGQGQQGEQFGGIFVELPRADDRKVTNRQFIQAWQEKIDLPAGIEYFTVTERQPGPPGKAIEIELTGSDAKQLKQAALELGDALTGIVGISAVNDDLPYGREQLIYRVNPYGQTLGITAEALGRQLRSAFDGALAQIYQDGDDEIEVRVQLPEEERNSLAALERLPIRLPAGGTVPTAAVIQLETNQGFEVLRHADTRLAATITADLDDSANNPNRVRAALREAILPDLVSRYGISYSMEGRAADQADTLGDMTIGVLLAMILIYIILAWVFGSYGWPLVVMAIIPFSFIGAVLGHLLLGRDLTVVSLFGMFGLSGIVVNDSIILLTFYRQLKEQGSPVLSGIIDAACSRLRQVLLTSLTTIAGLAPLLFERALEAQFLIPMAISISAGLAFSTLLILLVIPALLALYESAVGAIDKHSAEETEAYSSTGFPGGV
ncbi:MAG: efflux RND transporter permease subunit, partial [Gammaproteobacteria bacterium]|nr:efflux RND transporter permease subunit [Gammaproteobacteria bacterium]